MSLLSFFTRRSRGRGVLDLRGTNEDLLETFRLTGGSAFVVDVSAENIRVLGFWGADPNNPFVLTLREYAAGRCKEYKGSPLEDFYHRWQPFAAGKCAESEDVGPPWRKVVAKKANTAAGRIHRREFADIARELGVPSGEIRGHIKGGPVSDAFGEITFRRFARLYDSIARDGFRPESSAAKFPSGFCFSRDGDWRVSIGSGKHRVTVMLALGWSKIPVEFGPPKLPVITRREEVDQWPNVRSGRYSREEALGAFDVIFRHTHPSGWRHSGIQAQSPVAGS